MAHREGRLFRHPCRLGAYISLVLRSICPDAVVAVAFSADVSDGSIKRSNRPRLLRAESVGIVNGSISAAGALAQSTLRDTRDCYQPHSDCLSTIRTTGYQHAGILWKECMEFKGEGWCALVERPEQNHHWRKCKKCTDCGLPASTCKAEFTYKGSQVRGCTYDGDMFGQPWCSLVDSFSDSSRASKSYAYCQPCECPMCTERLASRSPPVEFSTTPQPSDRISRAECWEPHASCLPSYYYNGEEIDGCTDVDSPGVFWCSKFNATNTTTFQIHFKEYCTLRPACSEESKTAQPEDSSNVSLSGESCWLPHESCLPEFKFRDESIDGCTRKGGTPNAWCSDKESVDAPSTLSCSSVPCEQCHIPDPRCKFRWSIIDENGMNRTIHGCTSVIKHPNMAPGRAWCSLQSVYEHGPEAEFAPCDACRTEHEVNMESLNRCWTKDSACVAEFTYRGVVHTDCMEQESGEAFCSETHYAEVDNRWRRCQPCDSNGNSSKSTPSGEFTLDKASDVMSSGDDFAVTYAMCPLGYVQTSCSCLDLQGSCAGARRKDDVCAAYNKKGGSGVGARTRCIRLSDGAVWKDARVLGEPNDAVVTAACEDGFEIVSCACFHDEGRCADAMINGSVCVARSRAGLLGSGISAEAVCAKIPSASRWKTVTASITSPTTTGGVSKVSCPADLTMLSCGCSSEDGSCAGSEADKRLCFAKNKAGGTGVLAYARCAEMRQQSWCWSFNSVETQCTSLPPMPLEVAPEEVSDVFEAKMACDHLGDVCGGVITQETTIPLMAWQGCFADPNTQDLTTVPSKSLTQVDPGAREWNAQLCAEACLPEGYTFIALRRKFKVLPPPPPDCFCGDTYYTYDGVKQVPDSECGAQCVGAPNGTHRPCGAFQMNAIYRIGKKEEENAYFLNKTKVATDGMSSSCPSLKCLTLSNSGDKGLKSCSNICETMEDCNAFNFCPNDGSCKTSSPEGGPGRCCLLMCDWSNTTLNYNLRLTDSANGWIVYRREVAPRRYDDGPSISKDALARCHAEAWIGEEHDAQRRCDAAVGCSLIFSEGCKAGKSWKLCKVAEPDLTPPRFVSPDRSVCTKVVSRSSEWLPCVGNCSLGKVKPFDAAMCPIGHFLVDLVFSVGPATQGSQVWLEKGQCSDGTNLTLGGSSGNGASSSRYRLRQEEGFSVVSMNAWLYDEEAGLVASSTSISGLRYLSVGSGPCTNRSVFVNGTEYFLNATNASCSVGSAPSDPMGEPQLFTQCPILTQRVAGWRVSAIATRIFGLEFYCASLPAPPTDTMPCEGVCTGKHVMRKCPPGSVIQHLSFASDGKSEIFLLSGNCSDGTVLRDESAYPDKCKTSHKHFFALSSPSPDGIDGWSVNSDMNTTRLTAFRVGKCQRGSPKCTHAVPGGGLTMSTIRCPEPTQKLVGWTTFTSCHVDGIQFMCADGIPPSPGWSGCQGDCDADSGTITRAECPPGAFVNSVFLRHDGKSMVFMKSGTCSDGSTIGTEATPACAKEFYMAHTLHVPKGARFLYFHGFDSEDINASANASNASNASSSSSSTVSNVLAFLQLGDCVEEKCRYGWELGGKKELRCTKLGQRISGWSVNSGCGIEGLQILCREPGEPSVVQKVTYCEPKSFVTNMKTYSAGETRPAAYTPTPCFGFCGTFEVKSSGISSVNGKYILDQTMKHSDEKPVWSKGDFEMKREQGRWLIEDEATRLYDGGEGGSPPAGQWAPVGVTAGPGPRIVCLDAEGVVSEDPCWKPNPKCVNAFAFEGVTYKGCTKTSSTQYWCGTDKFVYPEKNWALCVDDLACRLKQKAIAQEGKPYKFEFDCYLPAPTCKKSFLLDDLMYTECVDDPNGNDHWCSQDDVFQVSVGKWEPCKKTLCKMGEVQNVALHAEVESSSVAEGGPADRATDGDGNNGVFTPFGSCTQTLGPSPGEHAWVKVDLYEEFEVIEVKLVGRDDDFGYQSHGWKITVGNNGSIFDNVCADFVDASGGQLVSHTCGMNPPGPMRPSGRYVTIWSESPIVLCEIEVMGQMCWKPHPECAYEFATESKPNEITTGCFLPESGKGTPWCSLDLEFTGRWKQCESVPCVPTAPRPQPAVETCIKPDPACAPIFDYDGNTYHGCTDLDARVNIYGETVQWCSLNRTYEKHRTDCSEVLCSECWVRDHRCVENFTYNGQSYLGCTNVESSAFWCSIVEDYDGNTEKRKYCHPCAKNVPKKRSPPKDYIDGWPSNRHCWKLSEDCVAEFTKDAKKQYGCQGSRRAKPWCSKYETYAGDWAFCEKNFDAWQPHPSCVETFEFESKTVFGCMPDDSGGDPWCSLESTFVSGRVMPCKKCEKDPNEKNEAQAAGVDPAEFPSTECYQPVAACVPTFQYKGMRFQGCTNEDSNEWWCSHADVYSELRGFSRCVKSVCDKPMQSPVSADNVILMVTFTVEHLKFDEIDELTQKRLKLELEQVIGNRFAVDPARLTITLSGEEASLLALDASTSSSSRVRAHTSGLGDLHVQITLPVHEDDEEMMEEAMNTPESKGALLRGMEAVAGLESAKKGDLLIDLITVSNLADAGKMQHDCYQISPKCVPAFQYQGKKMSGCTQAGAGNFWCSHHQDYRGESSPCTNKPCEDCWNPAAGCKASFTYKGKKYEHCTAVDFNDGVHWCSLVDRFVMGSSEWKTCTPCTSAKAKPEASKEADECFEPVEDCVTSFEYKGKAYTGCTKDYSSLYWCSLKHALDKESMAWRTCRPCGTGLSKFVPSQDSCFMPHDDCVGKFEYKGLLYNGCTSQDALDPWCSKAAIYEGGAKWASCKAVDCATCFVRHNDCVSRFWHQGQEIRGCSIDANSGAAWCSGESVFRDGTSPWFMCDPCATWGVAETADVCHVPKSECQPTFEYDGRRHIGCSTIGSARPWCPLKYNHVQTSKEWEYCEKTNCDNCFVRDSRCASPFSYKGASYTHCVKENGGIPWCAKEADHQDGGEWFECTPCSPPSSAVTEAKGAADECYAQDPACVPEFLFEGDMHVGCTSKGSDSFWCSETKFFENRVKSCRRVSCDVCFIRDSACLPEFVYKGHKVAGCTTEDSSPEKPWCSKDAVVNDEVKNWAWCSHCEKENERRPADTAKKCYSPHPDCVIAFKFDDIEFEGCTQHESPHHWCSMVPVLSEGDVANTQKCEETPCDICFMRAATCKSYFRYNGQAISGCTKLNSDKWWCSNDEVFVDGSGSWEHCRPCDDSGSEETSEDTCWNPVSECVELFKYKGSEYRGCTNMDSGKFWCSKDFDFDASGRFAFCEPLACPEENDQKKLTCYEPPLECKPEFVYKGNLYSGCTRADHAIDWCSHSVVFEDTGQWSRCNAVPCKECFVRAPECVESFDFGTLHISGCTSMNSNIRWCSHERIFEEATTLWSACSPCDGYEKVQQKVCHQPLVECVRNFFYKGKMYEGCTNEGSRRHWCSKVRHLAENSSDFLYCKQESCNSCWQMASGCVGMFTYAGQNKTGCVSDDSGSTPWCSLEADLAVDSKKWKLCERCHDEGAQRAAGEDEKCWKPHPKCVQPFAIDGRATSGCIYDEQERKGWCSTVSDFSTSGSATADYEWCESVECDRLCWQPTHGCQHFRIGNRLVTGCEDSGGHAPWCSTSEVYDPSKNDWQYCKAVACDQICYGVDEGCVQPFEYLGKTIAGCSTLNSSLPWCSEVPLLNATSTSWRYCKHVSCDNVCHMPASDCFQPYTYKGQAMTGCVKPDGYNNHICPKGDELKLPVQDDSVIVCSQVPCTELCYRLAEGCKKSWTFNGTVRHGCLIDKTMLKGKLPWCSKSSKFEAGSSAWSYCPQIPCSEAECMGPQCDGFLLLRVPDGRCVKVEGRNPNLDSFSLTLEGNCNYPDYNGFMVKEVPTSDGHILLQHISGRCVQPDPRTLFIPQTRLLVKDECAEKDIMKFKRIGVGDFAVLRHFSGRCVGAYGYAPGILVISACGSGSALEEDDPSSRALQSVALVASKKRGNDYKFRLSPSPCLWAEWDDWGACSVSCFNEGSAQGVKQRRRSIGRPQEDKGKACHGDDMESAPCGKPCSKDCVLGGWTPWSPCSEACGGGISTRSLKILEWPIGAGKKCDNVNETTDCNNHPCPVACLFGEWTEWDSCSKTCGEGLRRKTKNIVRHPMHGGKPCGVPPKVIQPCGGGHCPQHCSLGPWEGWDGCTKTCGGGITTRKRSVTVPSLYGGKRCVTIPVETQACNQDSCPIDCYWLSWMDWTSCSLSCGGGIRFRKRLKVVEMYGGRACKEANREEVDCNINGCPQNCVWNTWAEWSVCTKSCSGGIQYRSRAFLEFEKNGGTRCTGQKEESRACSIARCPVDCEWEEWESWGECSASCGGGVTARPRKHKQRMMNGGLKCFGQERQYKMCKTIVCPVDCVWNTWTPFSGCSVTCGGGEQSRSRSMQIIAKNGGAPCDGPAKEEKKCSTRGCPVHCVFDAWMQWTSCDKTCGVGHHKRERTKSIPLNEGKQCEGVLHQEKSCNVRACPIDCKVQPWLQWNDCSATCDGGRQKRTRTIFQPRHGGAICEGDKAEERVCKTAPCPVDCEYSQWTPFSACTLTCGRGSRKRLREKVQEALFGGKSCSGGNYEYYPCNAQQCPVDCQWDDWQSWSMCSRSCGGGKRYRIRAVKVVPEYGGNLCRGTTREQWSCHTNPCKEDYGNMPDESEETDNAGAAGNGTSAAPAESKEKTSEAEAKAQGVEEEEKPPSMVATFGLAVVMLVGLGALPFLWKAEPAK